MTNSTNAAHDAAEPPASTPRPRRANRAKVQPAGDPLDVGNLTEHEKGIVHDERWNTERLATEEWDGHDVRDFARNIAGDLSMLRLGINVLKEGLDKRLSMATFDEKGPDGLPVDAECQTDAALVLIDAALASFEYRLARDPENWLRRVRPGLIGPNYEY